MNENLTLKYYGLERQLDPLQPEWTRCGIIGASSDISYSEIRKALSLLENFRVCPIDDKLAWVDIFKAGKIIEFKTLCVAVAILCTKPNET